MAAQSTRLKSKVNWLLLSGAVLLTYFSCLRTFAQTAQEVVIQKRDVLVLSVSIATKPEGSLSGVYAVDSNGAIFNGRMGSLQVAGSTPAAIATMVEKSLEPEYKGEARTSVRWILNAKDGHVSKKQITQAISEFQGNPQMFCEFATTLGSIGVSSEPVFSELKKLLEDHDPGVRLCAAFAFTSFGPHEKPYLPALFAFLENERAASTYDMGGFIWALCRNQERTMIPVLVRMLESGTKYSADAAGALSSFPDASVAPHRTLKRIASVEIKALRTEISGRDPFSLGVHAVCRSEIEVNKMVFPFEGYFGGSDFLNADLVFVFKLPSGKSLRLNGDRADYLSILEDPDFLNVTAEGFGRTRWATKDIPDFTGEGTYTLYLEGIFRPEEDGCAPVKFISNKVTFTVSKQLPSEQEKIERMGGVEVKGEINKPGKTSLTANGLHLTEAIAAVGGPTCYSSTQVALTTTRADGSEEKVRINLQDIAKKKMEDPLLHNNDVIFVPAADF